MTFLKPIAEGLWTDEVEPRLIAGRRKGYGELVFPMPVGSAAEDYEAVPLPRSGTLWSWTIQAFLPKSPPYAGTEGPEAFKPYAVGYVQLGDMLIVEGRLTQTEGLEIGMPMKLDFIPFGDEALTYAFTPGAAA
jgi:uncharacterized OB-fold protein